MNKKQAQAIAFRTRLLTTIPLDIIINELKGRGYTTLPIPQGFEINNTKPNIPPDDIKVQCIGLMRNRLIISAIKLARANSTMGLKEAKDWCEARYDRQTFQLEATMLALADSAAEQLEGTCKSIHDLGPEIEQAFNDQIFCNRLDELVFECEQCEWWCEIGEMSDEGWICDDCNQKDED